jgi:hypothetical protein
MPELKEVVARFLERSPGRWLGRGYGQSNCSSCGALRTVDYGDQDIAPSEKREPCSPSCPWRQLEEAARMSGCD